MVDADLPAEMFLQAADDLRGERYFQAAGTAPVCRFAGLLPSAFT